MKVSLFLSLSLSLSLSLAFSRGEVVIRGALRWSVAGGWGGGLVQGYLAHKTPLPPSRPTVGPHAQADCRVLHIGGCTSLRAR